MQISPQADKFLHSKLPIDEDEKILAIYRHHWFAYAASWIVAIVVVVVVMGLAYIFTSLGGDTSPLAAHKSQVMAIASVFCILILLGSLIPVYLRSQEQVVLTEEALLQVVQPSLFASKIDQLSLQHISDVSVKQDFFGTLLGYGYITVETPGEQNNYQFATLPNPHAAAREIISAHENFDAALQGGRMPSTLGSPASQGMQQIDPHQYQQFLAYQRMVAQQQQDQAAQGQGDDAANGQNPPDTSGQS
jgi:hypothetical protein